MIPVTPRRTNPSCRFASPRPMKVAANCPSCRRLGRDFQRKPTPTRRTSRHGALRLRWCPTIVEPSARPHAGEPRGHRGAPPDWRLPEAAGFVHLLSGGRILRRLRKEGDNEDVAAITPLLA